MSTGWPQEFHLNCFNMLKQFNNSCRSLFSSCTVLNYFWWSLISDHFQMGGWCEVVTNPVSCIFGGVKYIPSADSDQPWHCSHREVQPEWSLRTSCVSLPACAWQLGKTLQHSFLFCHISSRIYNLGGHVSFLSHLCNVKTVDRECFIL